MFKRRWLGVALWVVLILCGLLACFVTATGLLAAREEAKLARALAAIRRSGAPTKFSQLAPPSIPDTENAARVYEQAFRLLQVNEQEHDFLRDFNRLTPVPPEPAAFDRARWLVDRNGAALALVERAAGMPRCAFPVDWNGAPYAALYPHFAQLSKCAHLLAAKAILLARAGEAEAALQTCSAAFAVSESLASEATVLSQLVRYGLIGAAYNSLASTLYDSHPSPALCMRLSEDLARIDVRPGFIAAVEGERAAGLSTFDIIRNSRDPYRLLKTLGGEEGQAPSALTKPPPLYRRFLSPGVRFVSAVDELTYLRFMNKAVQLAPLPYRDSRQQFASLEHEVDHLPGFPPRVVTGILLPDYSRMPLRRDAAAARLGLAQVALQLKAYRATHSAYPQSLSVLEQALAKPLPQDPFSARSFVYRRQGQGFLLYSWGPNLQDDRGVPPIGRTEAVEGDILFQCSR